MIEEKLRILGLQPYATADQLKQAYRKLSKIHHPDVNQSTDAMSKFQEISNAYEWLKKNGTNPLITPSIDVQETNETSEYELWKISVRENKKKKIKEREAYRLKILLEISRYTRIVNFMIMFFCLFILADHAFSADEEKMRITKVKHHYETARRTKKYMLDIIYFGELKLICETGSIKKVSGQTEVTVYKNLFTNNVKYIKFNEQGLEFKIKRLPYLRFLTAALCIVILLFTVLYFKTFINEEHKLTASMLMLFFFVVLLVLFFNY